MVLENQQKEQVVEDCGWKRGPRREARGIFYTHSYRKTLLLIINALNQVYLLGHSDSIRINGQ